MPSSQTTRFTCRGGRGRRMAEFAEKGGAACEVAMARDVTSRDCAASARSEQYTPRRSPSRSDGRGTIPRPVSRTLQSPMTTFDDRYRLLKCVALGGGMRTHNAQEKATGRPVMVHIV